MAIRDRIALRSDIFQRSERKSRILTDSLQDEKVRSVKLERDARTWREESLQRRKEVNDLLCHGFQFEVRKFEPFMRTMDMGVEVDWTRNMPCVSRLIKGSVVDLERIRTRIEVPRRTLRGHEMGTLVNRIAETLAWKICEELIKDQR